MKILITSTLRRPLGHHITASRSRVVYQLVIRLLKRGHNVSILAPNNSIVKGATIIPIIPRGLVEMPSFENQFYAETAYLTVMARQIQKIAPHFDIIHNHSYPEYINLLVERTLPIPMITTLHAPVTAQLDEVLSYFPDSNIVIQSHAVKKLFKLSHPKWVVHNGVDQTLFKYSSKKRDYILWVGRLGQSKNRDGEFIDGKGVRDAIKVAKMTNKKLYMIGNIENNEFYEKDVRQHLSSDIQWLSPLDKEQTLSQKQICKIMQAAKILLISTKFEEAFGLVAAEAMACGTPVVTYAKGSIPEIVNDGETGYVVNYSRQVRNGKWSIKEVGLNGLAQGVEKIYKMSEHAYSRMQQLARERIEKDFTLDTMVANYEQLYKNLILNKS